MQILKLGLIIAAIVVILGPWVLAFCFILGFLKAIHEAD